MKNKADIKNRFVIIMAGGRGERFWPVSREKTPKQLIPLLGKRSFLQDAVDRVAPLVPLKNGLHLAETIPGATLIVYPNTGHIPEVERAEEFNHDILDFLEH